MGVAVLIDLYHRDVKRLAVLGLEFVMVEDGVLAHDNLGYRIGEAYACAQADIAFDNGHVGLSLGYNQAPRERNERHVIGRGYMDHVHGLWENDPFREPEIRAVL